MNKRDISSFSDRLAELHGEPLTARSVVDVNHVRAALGMTGRINKSTIDWCDENGLPPAVITRRGRGFAVSIRFEDVLKAARNGRFNSSVYRSEWLRDAIDRQSDTQPANDIADKDNHDLQRIQRHLMANALMLENIDRKINALMSAWGVTLEIDEKGE